MAGNSASILIRILGDADDAKRAVGEIDGKFAQMGKNLAKVGVAVGVAAVGAAAVFGKSAISAASNFDESMSKVNVVFGEASEEVVNWSKNSAKAFGQSQGQALEAAGTYGNLFKAFGLNDKAAQGMSTSMVELAADLASFNNTSVPEALQALQSGVSGETEPLKRYGIAINDVRLKEEALALGLISSTKDALTPAAKAQASYSLIMKDSALAQGDFARTSDGLANKQRIMAAQFEDVKTKIGQALLPAMSAVVGIVSEQVIPAVTRLAEEWIPKLTAGFQQVQEWVVAHWPEIRAVIAEVIDALIQKGVELYGWFVENILPGLRAAAQEVVDWFGRNWHTIRDVFEEVALFIGRVVDAFVTVVMPALVDAFTPVVRFLRDDFWPIVQDVWHWMRDNIPPIVDTVITVVSDLWNNYLQPFAGFLQDAFNKAMGIARDAFDVLKGAVDTVVTVVQALWDNVLSPYINFLKNQFKIGMEVARVAFDVLKTAADAVWTAVQAVWDVGVGTVDFLKNAFKRGFETARDAADQVTGPLNSIVGFLQSIIDKGRQAVEWLKRVASAPRRAAGGLLGALNPFDGDIIPGFASGVRNFSGGLAVVGEGGRELVNLPPGSSVYNHRDTENMIGGRGSLLNVEELNVYEGVDMQAAMQRMLFHLRSAA